ncbi:MAG: Gfo/Idh/MocA family oxidoreductase [Candidatus Sumerlaeota bacterium]|nr:Gfo/Idh/MocA family oxidoreductase [Candidatus Sumerlaeota bacterium]
MSLENLSRRRMIKAGVAAAAVPALFHIVPRYVLGQGQTPPSEKLNIAGIGVGGQGFNDLKNFEKDHNIVALCDVDDNHAGHAYKQWPKAQKHKDFRKMLDAQKDIDAVVIATPDHLHCVISMWAMKLGKHVYCEKPMAHTVAEARLMAKAAAAMPKVATQMGNQGNAGEGVRLIQEWIEDGAIGAVRNVHAWTNKPVWPQGIERPKETPPVPDGLDWDLWLGPAPQRPYNPRVSSIHLARMVGFRLVRHRRHGLPRPQQSLARIKLGIAHQRRSLSLQVHEGNRAAGFNDLFRFPRARSHAAGSHHLVRRRHHAAAPG